MSQNRWPSLKFDIGAVSDLLSPLFGAGFYYKMFMGPNLFGRNWAWTHVYEPMIRRAAGLGAAPREPDPDRYQRTFDHCDVLIVGAGPAGLAAALAASESGARVVVCDENPALGGSLLAEGEAETDGKNAPSWLEHSVAALRSAPNVRLMPRTQAFGYYAQNFVALNERIAEPDLIADPDLPRERLWQMRAREVVLATGAIERPLVFPNNDRPGVMLADSARRYCSQYGAKVGERVVVATAHDSAYRAALDLRKAGVNVELIADLRDEAEGPLQDAARDAGIEVAAGAEILGVDGRLRVKAVPLNISGMKRERRLRRAPHVGRLDAFGASLLAIARQTRLRRGAASVQARSVRAARALGRRLQRDLRSWARARGRQRGGARGGGRGRLRRASRRESTRALIVFPRSARRLSPRPFAPIVAPKRSSISRTTCAPRTWTSRSRRACARSNTSSATPPLAWRLTRASSPT